MFWNRYPVFRLLICYCAGVVMANFFKVPSAVAIGLLSLAVIFIGLLRLTKPRFSILHFPRYAGSALNLFFLAVGILNSQFYLGQYKHQAPLPNEPLSYLVEVQSVPKTKPRSLGMEVKLLGYYKQNEWVPRQNKAMLYLQKSAAAKTVQYGHRLIIKGKFSELQAPANPYEFDYKNYLNLKAITHQAYADSNSWHRSSVKHGIWLIKLASGWQQYLINCIQSWRLNPTEAAVSKALLLGYRDDIDDELLKAYSSAGAMHVLAVSGLHVGIVYIMLKFSLFFLGKNKWQRILKLGLIVGFLWSYALITGLSASVVRAATMFTFVAIGQVLSRQTSIYNTIVVSALFLLVLKPTYLFEVGFQLSYAAVFGIVWLQPRLEKLMKRPPTKLLRGLWSITTVSIAAQLATFPLGLYYFHQFPGLFLISNILVIPLVTVLMYFGLVLLGLTAVGAVSGYAFSGWMSTPWQYIKVNVNDWHNGLQTSPFAHSADSFPEQLSRWAIGLFDGFLHLLNYAVNLVEQQGYLFTQIHLSRLELCLIYLLIITGCLWLISGGLMRLRFALLSLLILLALQFWENYRNNQDFGITAYSTSQGEAWGFYGQGQGYLWAPVNLLANNDGLTFHIKHHWWALNLTDVHLVEASEPRYRAANFFKQGSLVNFGNKVVAVESTQLAADIWLIAHSRPQLPEGTLKPELVVLNIKNANLLNAWLTFCTQNEIKFIDGSALAQKTIRWPIANHAKPIATYAFQ